MKNMQYTKLVIIIFLISFSLIITPQFNQIVSAASYSTDFEDGTLTTQYASSWLNTAKVTGTNFNVNTGGHNAAKCFRIGSGACSGYWNYTYSINENIYNWTAWFLQDSSAGAPYTYLYFQNSTGANIITLKIRHNNGHMYNVDHLGADIDLGFYQVYHDLQMLFTAKDDLDFEGQIGHVDSSPSLVSNDYRIKDIYITSTAPATVYAYIDEHVIETVAYSGPPLPGVLYTNCFDEVSGSNITNFNVVAVNQIGVTFFDYNLNNTYGILGSLLPQGETTITISALNYYPRSYLVDIESGYFVIDGVTYDTVTINAYLAHVNVSKLYFFQVIDEVTDGLLNPVEDVRIVIKGLCANTSYETVSDLQTDSYGYTMTYLIPGRNYQFTISKTGYITKTENWIPDASYFGLAYPKVFKITLNPPNATYLWSDYITFTGSLNNATSILYVNYTDALTNTTDWQLFIYRIDPTSTTPTLVKNWSGTNDSFALSENVTDSTDDYKVVFHVNHTNFGYNVIELYFYGYHPGITSAAKFNLLFTLNYGYNPFGWANTFMFFVILGCFFSFGRSATYMSVFAIGLLLLFVNMFIGIETVWTGLAGGAFPIILIFFGILMLVRDRGSLGVS